jgi:hypothetical protein
MKRPDVILTIFCVCVLLLVVWLLASLPPTGPA